MAKNLQIANEIFQYPENGENPGWGEEATAWACAVTEALSDLIGPNDILLTSAALGNNISTATDIPSFRFNMAEVLSFEATYYIERIYEFGTQNITEEGKIYGRYDGTDLFISQEANNDSGVRFDATASGQLQYTSDELPNFTSGTIRFRAKTIDRP